MLFEFARALGHRFTPIAKALQLQTVTDVMRGNLEAARGTFGDSYIGNWCLVAPPATPTVDPLGRVTTTCDVVGVQVGSEWISLGAKDVRWSKFSQDAQAGEVALFCAFGSRLFLGEHFTALNGAGAFLSFDVDNKKVGLSGYPASAGAGAAYLTIDTTTIGLVSATGGASFTVKADQITASGGAISLNGGTVNLGTGAADPVVTVSKLQAVLSTIVSWMATHVHTGGTLAGALTGVSASVPLTATGSTRVNAAI